MENPFELIFEKLNAIEIAIKNLKIENNNISQIEFMNINELARYVNLAKSSIYGLVHQKRIPSYKLGKKLYFNKIEIDNWILSNKKKTIIEINQFANDYLIIQRK